MPELPEVEVAARNLRRWALGRTITGVDADATRVLRPGGPRDLAVLIGARVDDITRIGKHLLLTLHRAKGRWSQEPTGVLSHLGMTGKWLRRKGTDAPPPHSRLRLSLDDGHVLHYADMRLFGRFRVVPGARFDEVDDIAALGPDPLTQGIDVERLWQKLVRTKQPVKVALMDQALLPGVGNIQASEALYRAGIDPRRAGTTITRAQAEAIANGIRDSIADTLADFHAAHYDGGDGADVSYVEEGAPNTFRVYAREGEACLRCAKARGRSPSKIERVVLGGRATYFCPACQK